MQSRRAFLGAATAGALSANLSAAVADEAVELYSRTLVIDALSFAVEWDDVEAAAVRKSGYSGIITSLPRQSMQVAMGALIEWQGRALQQKENYLIALRAADFEAARNTTRMAVLMNFQDASMLEKDIDNVDVLHALGTRCIQLTYNSRNLLGDGCTERTNAGLSEFGVEVVTRMNKLGVLIDLSHCGAQTTLDGIALSNRPVAITHSMCESLRPGHPRAKSDDQLRRLADKGGVIGIAALGYFVGADPGGKTTIENYADHIEHAVNIAGYEHVGLSTDFPVRGIASWATRENWYEPRLQRFKPSYDVKWPPWIPELDTPLRFLNLTRTLMQRGWTPANLTRLLGANWQRLLRETIG